ncbi:helix-turn-helix transcriptional regulator [Micromonospora sp. NPDC050200]|uniref:helix-turn-helix domain-containing protein n=1 Tax=Micromonospora sp. NPDC050200 TaxID=3155664 RepID=UPI0033C1BD9A
MIDVVPACPSRASTPGEYVASLRQLRQRSGLTYREISRRATAAGHWLPASTLATTLGRVTLPQERVVLALLAACETPDAQTRRWLAVRNEIEMRLAEAVRPDHRRPPEALRPGLIRVGGPLGHPGPAARCTAEDRRAVTMRLTVATAVCVLAGTAGLLAVRWRGTGRPGVSASGDAGLGSCRCAPAERQ